MFHFRKTLPDQNRMATTIAATLPVITSKLDQSLMFKRKADAALARGDADQCTGFLHLAQAEAQDAIALMEAASLLHDAGLREHE